MKKLKISGLVLAVAAAVLVAGYYTMPGAVVKAGVMMNRLKAGVEKKSIAAGSHTWFYLEGGKGETMVFVHGFNQNKDMWGDMVPAFSKKYHVIVPDMPGFGETETPLRDGNVVTVEAALLHEFLTAKGVRSCHMIGISLGGGIAACYAADHPEKLRFLALIAPYGVRCPKQSDFQREYARGKLELAYRDLEQYRLTREYALHKELNIPDHIAAYLAGLGAKRYDFLVTTMARHNRRYGWNCAAGKMRQVAAPTLIIFGVHDRIIDSSCGPACRDMIKGSELVMIEDCGHVAYMDQPEKVIGAYDRFLEKLKI